MQIVKINNNQEIHIMKLIKLGLEMTGIGGNKVKQTL